MGEIKTNHGHDSRRRRLYRKDKGIDVSLASGLIMNDLIFPAPKTIAWRFWKVRDDNSFLAIH